MSLSGGVGFQSTHVMARSSFSGAKTSTAKAFGFPVESDLPTSKSKPPHHAGDIFSVGNLLAVQPDVRAVIDAVKMQPGRSLRRLRGRRELGSEPPRTTKRAVLRHFLIGKKRSRRDSPCPEAISGSSQNRDRDKSHRPPAPPPPWSARWSCASRLRENQRSKSPRPSPSQRKTTESPNCQRAGFSRAKFSPNDRRQHQEPPGTIARRKRLPPKKSSEHSTKY